MKYRIETTTAPIHYWNSDSGFGWTLFPEDATEYSQAERNAGTLPANGCWVIINSPAEHLGDLSVLKNANSRNEDAPSLAIAPAELRRNHFTTIKLRPTVIRLSTTEGDYEDLNAQALEFEAALRLWVKGQQILTDGWMVDVIDED